MRLALVLALALGACARSNEADLPAIVGLRSAAAEWALVNREARRGRLTSAYVGGMRDAARKAIASDARGLRSDRRAAQAAAALLALPADAPPERIERQVALLLAQEQAL